ncbi:MAG: lysophospholipid acyltransferase family protein [Pyrinomonadaceae bacterium MAG19_C2-C3]|nr:lysophospholipid acyltransferase family protein [Pyrinomonadaceae bacterium MAG19_C2-C3]
MAKRGKLQNNAEYLTTRLLLGALETLPRPVAVAAGRKFGALTYRTLGNLRRTGERNLQLAFPEKSEGERERILQASFASLGRLLGEFSHLSRHTPESLRAAVDYDETGMSYLDEARATGRGIIFLTLHLGAWELLSFAHSAIHHPLAFMVRRLDNPLLETFVDARRTRFGNETIDKKSAVRRALKVLREGGTLGILGDLNTQPQEGVFVPFFGIPACTTAGIAMLTLRTDAVIVPACAPWDERQGKYIFQGQKMIDLERSGDNEKDVLAITTACTQAIENFVRAYPEQWLWVHKRWRTRPPGEPDLYGTRHPSGVEAVKENA